MAMAHVAEAWHGGINRLDRDGPVPRPAADRFSAVLSGARTVRSWPLLVLAAPAAAEVWSGWVGIAQKTGFGLVSPLPGASRNSTMSPIRSSSTWNWTD